MEMGRRAWPGEEKRRSEEFRYECLGYLREGQSPKPDFGSGGRTGTAIPRPIKRYISTCSCVESEIPLKIYSPCNN